jgi:hypothetical protein
MIRVLLPYQLQTLAQVEGEVQLDLDRPATVGSLIKALEFRYPMMRGTIVDHNTGRRRPRLRFYACSEDLSHESLDFLLPEEVTSGREPFLIVGAIAGG